MKNNTKYKDIETTDFVVKFGSEPGPGVDRVPTPKLGVGTKMQIFQIFKRPCFLGKGTSKMKK